MELTALKGVGPKRAEQLERLGVREVRDLWTLFPRDYEVFDDFTAIAAIRESGVYTLRARVVDEPRTSYVRRNFSVTRFKIDDGTGRISCVYYNQPYVAQAFHEGEFHAFRGRVAREFGGQMQNPAHRLYVEGEVQRPLPVYPRVQGLHQKVVRDAAAQALKFLDVRDMLPPEVREKGGLMELADAILEVHCPASRERLAAAEQRLMVEEMLSFQLTVQRRRVERERTPGQVLSAPPELKEALAALPYELTGAQKRVLGEILDDLSRPHPMARLVQGDVGSGKTVLAFLSLLTAAKNGVQGALMAPTEILARQHFAEAQKFFRPFGVRVGLILGSQKEREKRDGRERTELGAWDVVIGTHALIQGSVRFRNLGLVVTDEQHRFGAQQRQVLVDKGAAPHVLVMSATPIPRSLSLILYGDLDVSAVDELPPGRKPIETKRVREARRRDLYDFIYRRAKTGGQAYVVCPLVEDSEDLDVRSAESVYQELKRAMKGVSIAYLHGRMKSGEKEAVIERFRKNEVQVLVSTTVVEVGVNVPNATVMVIENAERFGLAQLHQLRGRVGRGGEASYCFLLEQEGSARLDVLARTQDGFEIAREDLRMRGPGEMMGGRQSGMMSFKTAGFGLGLSDVERARDLAVELLRTRPELAYAIPEHSLFSFDGLGSWAVH
ncbi:ATP-dependent DNA helicase RecG [Gehongia tenuis]|uniref:ATP-dependent DNA helicase RecG n=1 Tax=Gehongia tenuis TaxID=2763655 RepID=A0A926HKA8_9FIRM|nr:ATP-dependent DNA helicase RecG [Gehongia tenuis]MBC8530777.1 ATP-dependent DNA helicase RecG [Gehongia tenuis]